MCVVTSGLKREREGGGLCVWFLVGGRGMGRGMGWKRDDMDV